MEVIANVSVGKPLDGSGTIEQALEKHNNEGISFTTYQCPGIAGGTQTATLCLRKRPDRGSRFASRDQGRCLRDGQGASLGWLDMFAITQKTFTKTVFFSIVLTQDFVKSRLKSRLNRLFTEPCCPRLCFKKDGVRTCQNI